VLLKVTGHNTGHPDCSRSSTAPHVSCLPQNKGVPQLHDSYMTMECSQFAAPQNNRFLIAFSIMLEDSSNDSRVLTCSSSTAAALVGCCLRLWEHLQQHDSSSSSNATAGAAAMQ